jgi:hypothetical protein
MLENAGQPTITEESRHAGKSINISNIGAFMIPRPDGALYGNPIERIGKSLSGWTSKVPVVAGIYHPSEEIRMSSSLLRIATKQTSQSSVKTPHSSPYTNNFQIHGKLLKYAISSTLAQQHNGPHVGLRFVQTVLKSVCLVCPPLPAISLRSLTILGRHLLKTSGTWSLPGLS